MSEAVKNFVDAMEKGDNVVSPVGMFSKTLER